MRAGTAAQEVQLWPDQVIGEDGLKAYILAVRQALGERGTAPRRLQTIRGRGYRVVAPVTVETGPTPGASRVPETPPAPTGPGGPVGERKLVTLLGCTLTPATACQGRGGLDALHRQMRTLYTLTQEEVHCYDRTFHHVAGTRLLALFGTPVAYEDHARHALFAAWGLHQRLAASQRGDPAAEPLAACLGLHTGLMVGMRPLVAHCHRGLGTLYAQLGQREQAQTALSTAIALYRAMAVWYDPRRIQEVLRAHATVACDPGSPCLVHPTTV